ncbi:MAG: hypothetical protein RIM83_09230 [Allomuricauda sp.]
MLNINANATSGLVNLDTTRMFDHAFIEGTEPPIDTFINKIKNLTLLVNPASFDRLNGNLVLLGSVSAVESYMREVIRKCILIDFESRIKCEKHLMTYGAAISHEASLMPEAILEDVSFAGKGNIVESMRNFLGIKGRVDNSLDAILDEFVKVCQIRHCLVHRYGKLGTKNAIALGLSNHSSCIEKPLHLSYVSLQECQAITLSLVKEVNNYIFKKLLRRLIMDDNGSKKSNIIWQWDYRSDKKNFMLYYDILVSRLEPPTAHASAYECYEIYRDFYRNS